MEETKFQGKFVQRKIINYYKVNEVRKFMYSRPFNKGKNKDNEFATLWIERTVMQTKYSFPGILQWFPVESESVYELNPLRNAVETMTRVNEEIRDLIMEHQKPNNPPLNPLSMKLNGIIDAAVMGGTAKYEQAFFADSYLEENPDHADLVSKLKNLIAEQIPLLEAGIKIHEVKKTDDLKALHEKIDAMFKQIKAQVEEKYGKRTCDITVRRAGGNHQRNNANKIEERSVKNIIT